MFSSCNSKCISMSFIPVIQETECKLINIVCEVGTPNAMDFMLCTKLGAQVASVSKSNHYIVSNDKDYAAAVKHLTGRGYKKLSVLHLLKKYLFNFFIFLRRFLSYEKKNF